MRLEVDGRVYDLKMEDNKTGVIVCTNPDLIVPIVRRRNRIYASSWDYMLTPIPGYVFEAFSSLLKFKAKYGPVPIPGGVNG